MTDKVEAPWGHWQIIGVSPEGLPIKMLVVNPSGMLSLQSHRWRMEEWHPLADGLLQYTESEFGVVVESMNIGKVYNVYAGSRHRIINPTDRVISLVEIIRGKYDEKDITRHSDAYGRT